MREKEGGEQDWGRTHTAPRENAKSSPILFAMLTWSFRRLGIGIPMMIKSVTMFMTAFARNVSPPFMHFPGMRLSQYLSTGRHSNAATQTEMMVQEMTKAMVHLVTRSVFGATKIRKNCSSTLSFERPRPR